MGDPLFEMRDQPVPPLSGIIRHALEPDAPSPPNALCQTGQAEFPAIGLDGNPLTDLTMTAKFKPISGREDQAGGLIFRVQDKDNYYIARGNALEDNLIFFIYQNARRSQLKSASAKAAAGHWHELRVDLRGTVFVAYLDVSAWWTSQTSATPPEAWVPGQKRTRSRVSTTFK